jgi:hypothetical protein
VVQPLFYFLAEQIDLAGQQAEEEPALRIAYCDVNESCCSPAAVHGLIVTLQEQYGSNRRSSNGQHNSESTAAPACGDLWEALQQVGAGFVFALRLVGVLCVPQAGKSSCEPCMHASMCVYVEL